MRGTDDGTPSGRCEKSEISEKSATHFGSISRLSRTLGQHCGRDVRHNHRRHGLVRRGGILLSRLPSQTGGRRQWEN